MMVHQFGSGLTFDQEAPSLSLSCKRLRPQATPKNDIKRFIKPGSGSPEAPKKDSPHQVAEGGGRWNPTQEQLSILEMMYNRGIRTPPTKQIEEIASLLGKYGKIEGKNVFYWFQNHKARDRNKQKWTATTPLTPAGLNIYHGPTTPLPTHLMLDPIMVEAVGKEEESPNKRKCRSWTFDEFLELEKSCIDVGDRTLKLFPLHPELRK